MDKEIKKPKDLGLKVGTPDEVLWTSLKKNTEQIIQGAKDSLKIQTEVLKLAEKKIAEEKEKFK